MQTKLNKIARELNVGLSTVAEFLRKHNIEVDPANPNTRIDDAAVALLKQEYSKDRDSKKKSEDFTTSRTKDKKSSASSARSAEGLTSRPAGPRVVGKIDLDAVGKPKSATADRRQAPKPAAPAPAPAKAPEVTSAPAPAQTQAAPAPAAAAPEAAEKPAKEATAAPEVAEKPAKEATAATPAREEESAGTSNVFRIGTGAEKPHLRVVGTIDLNALNQSTRPKKKSKEERRRERTGQAGAAPGREKRKRIGKEKVDIDKASAQGTDKRADSSQGGARGNAQGGARGERSRPGRNARGTRVERQRAPQRQEVSTEDVQKQVKETLARLTTKQTKKSVKWRKEKREEMHNREMAAAEREAAESRILKLTEFVTANDLAQMMDVPVNNVIATCMNLGVMVSINQRLDAETINIVAEEFGFTTEYVSAEVSEAIATEEDNEEDLLPRPPIVTVMGHVDHGKTSLLDYIRNANVIAGEAGGITQHIGAYNVKLADGRHITFLDTPGHEAFTAMRARGAKVTDLAIIIVAADDDVMPQTIEAINHASAAGVPMVFAINKIDKPAANPDKIKEELAQMNYLVEEWGGKYQSQDISAKKGIGVDELMEKVLLEAEMLDLKANPDRLAVGSVIESSLDKGRGYVATVLVQNGTLRVGDVVLAGTHYGKVKAMFNERNQRVKEAAPATPVLILGLNGAPAAGDTFNVLETEQEAREIAAKREQLQRELGLRTKKRPGLEELGRRRALDDFHELNLVVKGDVDGSIEALSDSLIKLSTPEIQVNVLHKGVGAISESDVTLAAASDAIIIGFQVRPSGAARKEAEKEGVEIRLYSVIYKAIEEVKDAMEGLLAPEIKEEITGTAEVLQTYHISKVGTIAGAIVRDGKIKRGSKVRVIRDGIVIYTGELGSLKRFKDDVKEVISGYDCGLSVQGYNDIREGDMIEGFEEVEVKKTL
ncbi:MAG: translation initiation factor IF-2 [Muribaculaceae bacterium]|nr:translation initiation factor IF-2 [Muribaculaceae bacterium]